MNSQTLGQERQIVAMHLGDEVYGIDISNIDTVITPQPITPVPQTPDYIKGVMNLRGRILPVIDLRARFKISGKLDQADHRIVIVEVEDLAAGLIVDAVSEVLRLPDSSIQSPSDLLNAAELDVITGIGRIPMQGSKTGEECFILLLDVYKTLTTVNFDATSIAKLREAA
jgi:purine-binding chemotaxis protein CheW